MDVITAVKERYSYRGKYLADPVPRDILQMIMEAGLAAPSGCNKQTVSLIGVDDPVILSRLGILLGKPGAVSAPAAVCVLTQPVPAYESRLFNVQDYAAAIENILLTATSLGYASCWIEGYITDEKSGISSALAGILGVPDTHRLVAFLPIGIPAETKPRAERKPFGERAWFNGFENKNKV
jgi:nitroreductase